MKIERKILKRNSLRESLSFAKIWKWNSPTNIYIFRIVENYQNSFIAERFYGFLICEYFKILKYFNAYDCSSVSANYNVGKSVEIYILNANFVEIKESVEVLSTNRHLRFHKFFHDENSIFSRKTPQSLSSLEYGKSYGVSKG